MPKRVAHGLDGCPPRGDAMGLVEAWPVVESLLSRLPLQALRKTMKPRKAYYIDENLRDLQEW